MFQSLMTTNAMGERSFSKMKLIKNCHRSSMVQERLHLLAIMVTEYGNFQILDFEDVLNDVAITKFRKVNLFIY